MSMSKALAIKTTGVAYCLNLRCLRYYASRLVLAGVDITTDGRWSCPECSQRGMVLFQYGFAIGSDPSFGEVRVHYRFDPRLKALNRYSKVVVVQTDRQLEQHNIYHFFSPLISSDRRALELGELLLSNLLHTGEPTFKLLMEISWDSSRAEVVEQCARLDTILTGSTLRL